MSENCIDSKSTEKIIQESWAKGLTYQDYRKQLNTMANEGKTTGAVQSEALINYTKLNDRRMKRLDKTMRIDEITVAKIKNYSRKVTWLVLTESWCGDAAQSMPVMNKIAELNPNIDFKVILRDEHLELMDRFLYNGTLSIPKLIMTDKNSNEVLDDWGPRPSKATKMVEDYKAEHGKLTTEFKQELQVWYNKDKGKNILEDLTGLLLE